MYVTFKYLSFDIIFYENKYVFVNISSKKKRLTLWTWHNLRHVFFTILKYKYKIQKTCRIMNIFPRKTHMFNPPGLKQSCNFFGIMFEIFWSGHFRPKTLNDWTERYEWLIRRYIFGKIFGLSNWVGLQYGCSHFCQLLFVSVDNVGLHCLLVLYRILWKCF